MPPASHWAVRAAEVLYVPALSAALWLLLVALLLWAYLVPLLLTLKGCPCSSVGGPQATGPQGCPWSSMGGPRAAVTQGHTQWLLASSGCPAALHLLVPLLNTPCSPDWHDWPQQWHPAASSLLLASALSWLEPLWPAQGGSWPASTWVVLPPLCQNLVPAGHCSTWVPQPLYRGRGGVWPTQGLSQPWEAQGPGAMAVLWDGVLGVTWGRGKAPDHPHGPGGHHPW